MITNEKLKVYRKFSGDIDAFARSGSKADKETISSKDWGLIDSLLQDIKLHSEGRLSASYYEGLMNRIDSEVENSSVLETLKTMVQ